MQNGQGEKVINPGGDQEMAVMVVGLWQNFKMAIQVNLCRFLVKLGGGNTNSPELSLYHSHSLATS